jgi:hypothetical protein
MTNLIETKSMLAKLMATENITIEQRPVSTAGFDPTSRLLIVPILDNKISSQLYDLFMGHEVGHALYTPPTALDEAREKKIHRTVINVVEDSRIERKIKQKYPGLTKSFVKGYNELMDRDFFEIAGEDLNELILIDKINLHTKGGPSQGIKFNGVERYLLDKVENTQTFEEVVEVAEEIAEYMRLQEEQKQTQKTKKVNKDQIEPGDEIEETPEEQSIEETDEEQSPDEGEDGDENDEDSLDGDENDEDSLDGDESEEKGAEEGVDDHNNSGKSEAEKDEERKNIKSRTDEAFHKNESKLYDNSVRSMAYANVPEFDINEGILDHKALYNRYKKGDVNNYPYYSCKKSFNKIRNESTKVVSYLVKEFELRKNAEQMKKVSISKTGDLNMNKIFSYKFSEDIFKKISVVPNGKSHGLVIYLDWSGSMSNHMPNTIKQLFNLVLFCKKINIPYEVYAFTNQTESKIYRFDAKPGDLAMESFCLLNLLSSRMTASEFMYAGSVLCALGGIGASEGSSRCYWTNLSSTPLNQAVITAMEIVPAFQKKNRLQIVNTVFLTDGESDSVQGIYDSTNSVSTIYGFDRVVLRHNKTRIQETAVTLGHGGFNVNVTSALVKILKEVTKCNVVGFYVLSTSEFSKKINKFIDERTSRQVDKLQVDFRRDNSVVVTSAGFDEYYLLRSQGLAIDDEAELEVKDNATTRGLVSAFTKYTTSRLNNRVVLNRFIKIIS